MPVTVDTVLRMMLMVLNTKHKLPIECCMMEFRAGNGIVIIL
jgi:antitoxin component of RelBE/YafQ-DinJ toxin-antitoxin module